MSRRLQRRRVSRRTSGRIGQRRCAGYGIATNHQYLAQVDGLLAKVGTDKSRLLTATIYLTDIATFDEMNQAWQAWCRHKARPPVRRWPLVRWQG